MKYTLEIKNIKAPKNITKEFLKEACERAMFIYNAETVKAVTEDGKIIVEVSL